MNQNDQNSNWKNLFGFKNLQEKLENKFTQGLVEARGRKNQLLEIIFGK